jgi:hypothetical protein
MDSSYPTGDGNRTDGNLLDTQGPDLPGTRPERARRNEAAEPAGTSTYADQDLSPFANESRTMP